jgi:hypothetical protein
MSDWDMQDIKPTKGNYTWNNRRVGLQHIAARLDRFLINNNFLLSPLDISSQILPSAISDHKPITLSFRSPQNFGPLPFRFNQLWLDNPDIPTLVAQAWTTSISGSPNFVWESKLKAVKISLKDWVKKSYTAPHQEKQERLEQLRQIQQKIESDLVTEALMNQEKEAQQHLQTTLRREEEHWRLKSRSLWIKAGDSNTSFFHKQAQSRRKKNTVTSITSSTGQQIDSYEQIKAEAYHHYNNLYQQPREEAMQVETNSLLANIPNLVSDAENNQLTQEITEDEIHKAIWSLEPDKASGPDGFPIRFFRYFWDVIKWDLKKMLNYTLHKQRIRGATNSTFLALIPKDSNPSNFSRFHPISLCNSSYKILTKIIANRLNPLLTKLISENQTGFLRDKQITDNIVLVQEAIHSSKKTKTPGMVVKLDMENAFDRVKHNFLFSVLKAYGFSENFSNWIKACINNPWISPLLNGCPTNFFKASRGLWQGCPLSPSLYILLADSLSRKLEAERRTGKLPGLLITRGVKEINHSQFVR